MAKIGKKRKKNLRDKLYKRDGRRCHYCRIKEEDFIRIWGPLYGDKTRGRKLEIERKDNQKDYTEENCVLACAICNNAKSDKFTDEEFRRLGGVIRVIWQKKILKEGIKGFEKFSILYQKFGKDQTGYLLL
jgi:5-methylcytosine-specific restriction endonuclease McrA